MRWNHHLGKQIVPNKRPPHRQRGLCPALGDGPCRWQEPYLYVYCSGNVEAAHDENLASNLCVIKNNLVFLN